jgi:hypothetical protein
MDIGNSMPPTQLPKDIMQNYAMNSHREETMDSLPEDIEFETESAPYLLKHGGKWLSALIAISAVIFIILFYDSMCIENKVAAVTPDKVQLLLDHFKVSTPTPLMN